jgi:hypothetical protein
MATGRASGAALDPPTTVPIRAYRHIPCHLYKFDNPLHIDPLPAKLCQHRSGFLEVGSVKPFTAPAVNRGQQGASLSTFALLLPQLTQAHGRPEFKHLCLLTAAV